MIRNRNFLDPDGSGSAPQSLTKRYLYGAAVDQLLAQEDVTKSLTSPDRVLWPLADHLGTVRDLYKNDATLAVHYQYDSFGRVTSGDTSLTRYLYTSREHDAATGLQYNRARFFDSSVGRWLSEDPMGFAAGDPNLERYTRNEPVGVTDPSGLHTHTFPPPRRLRWWEKILKSAGEPDPSDFMGPIGTLGKGGKTAVKILVEVGKEAAENAAKEAAEKAAKEATEEIAKRIPASEKRVKDIARRIERDLGDDARRRFHDLKDPAMGDRTLEEALDDARSLYEEAGKELPEWLKE